MDYYDDFIIELKENTVTSTFRGIPENEHIALSEELKHAFEPNPETGEQKPLNFNKDQMEDFGDELFSVLFHGKVLQQFKDAMNTTSNSRAPDGSLIGLRILLLTEANASYPWEMMRSFEGNYLATDVRTPFLRIFPGTNQAVNIRDKLPQIMVILSQIIKQGLNAINTVGEWNNIVTALKDNPNVGKPEKVEEPPTRTRIMDKMRSFSIAGNPCNIIHFVGHGDFQDEKGYLLLPDEDCHEDKIDQNTVKNLFLNEESLGLVVLNSCNTAKIIQFSGLVPKLLSRIPAVVAMRQPISNNAAVSFASGFYKHLMFRRIEETIQRARHEMLLNRKCKPIDFSIPVLYLGWTDQKTVRKIFEKLTETEKVATELHPVIGNRPSEIVQALTVLAKLFRNLEMVILEMIDEPDTIIQLKTPMFKIVWQSPLNDVMNKCQDIKTNLCKVFPARQQEATQRYSDFTTELKKLAASIKRASVAELETTWNRTKYKCEELIASFSQICTQAGGI